MRLVLVFLYILSDHCGSLPARMKGIVGQAGNTPSCRRTSNERKAER